VVDYLHSGGNSLSGLIDSLEPTGLVPLLALTNFGNQAQNNFLINAFTGGAAGCNGTTEQLRCRLRCRQPQARSGWSRVVSRDPEGPWSL